MCHHFSLFCCGCFGFFLATSQSGICSCCSPPCQTSDDPSAILRLPTKQAKFHTWRAQRKLLWLQFVLRHLLVWLRLTGWMNWEHLRRLIRAVVCIWCSLDLIFFFFFFTLTARWGSQGSTAAPLRPDWFFTMFHIKCKPVSLQLCKVNWLISQLLFSAEGDGCQRQVMFAHYINLEQQIKSWSDFHYCMHNLAEKRCENSDTLAALGLILHWTTWKKKKTHTHKRVCASLFATFKGNNRNLLITSTR